MTKRKFKMYIFRVCSSRGTDFRRAFKLRQDITNAEALELAKRWAEDETANTACQEYTVSIRPVKPCPRREWLKKWGVICKKYRTIKDKKEDLYAISVPRDWIKE